MDYSPAFILCRACGAGNSIDNVYNLGQMSEASIRLLAKWVINQGCHIYNDPDLEALFILDDVRKKAYEENRIKAPGGFTEAAMIAFEAVIRKVIEMK